MEPLDVVGESNPAKRLHASKGDTSGKPETERKTRGRSMDMQYLVDLCSRILEHHLRYSTVWYICISLDLFFVYVNRGVKKDSWLKPHLSQKGMGLVKSSIF